MMRKKVFVLILLVSFFISFNLFLDKFKITVEYNSKISKNKQESRSFSETNLRFSNFMNLTGERILIDDRWDVRWPYDSYDYLGDPNNKTWAETAATEDWCTGSGTWDDPYIIENIYIDSQSAGSGITIWHSNVSFIIRNSYIHNSGSGDYDTGISLIHVDNGIIEKNNFTYNHHSLWLWESINNTISDNVMINDHSTSGFGKLIKMNRSYNNTISHNNSTNHYDGINLWDSNYNNISYNIINNTLFGHYPDTGLYLVNSNYSIITYNGFAGDYATFPNPYDDSIISQEGCVGNILENNFAENITTNSTMSINSFQGNLKISASDTWFTLSTSNYNYVFGNYLYSPIDNPKEIIENPFNIPGYNVFVILGLIGMVLTIHIVKRQIKERASNFI